MRYVIRNAPLALDRYIESLWYWEGGAPASGFKDVILPSASAGLLVNLTEDRLRWYDGTGYSVSHDMAGIGIVGPNSRPLAVDAVQPKIMGVKFRAAGAFPFLGLPLSALADRHISLADLWGPNATRLHQRIILAPTADECFDILISALKDRLPESFDYHPAASYALQAFRRRRCAAIATVAKETGLSQRKFIRIFSEQVGFRPKLYLRIERFQRVLDQIGHAPAVNWGDIVEENGYYDQSHFINDFENFSGLSPGAYLHFRGPHLQHVPIPGV